MSDRSTDGTDEIVRTCTAKHGWIELARMPERRERDSAGKALAFNAGYGGCKGLVYDIVGNVDGEISPTGSYRFPSRRTGTKTQGDPAKETVGIMTIDVSRFRDDAI